MTGNIISISLILVGAVLMIFAALKIRTILKLAFKKEHLALWLLLYRLVIAFIVFYLATCVFIFLDFSWLIIPLVGVVFVAGALFVWLVSLTTQRTLRELKRTTVSKNELEEANLQLQKSNEEVGKFAYIVSHDLKTPLRGISSLASFIEEDLSENADETVAHNLQLLRRKVTQMHVLIDGILNYSRLKEEDLPKKELATNVLLDEVVEMLDAPPGMQIVIPENLPTIKGNEVQIKQLFQNLISNAIKYHDKESGTISIGYDALENTHQFWVQDDGPGIPPEYHDRIFKMFATLGVKDKSEGSGIGLSIVQQIVENHNGTISVESSPGQGSKFIFTIEK